MKTREQKKAYQHAWYLANAERLKARQREWSATHKEQKAATDKAYREAHMDRIRATRAKNADKIRARHRIYCRKWRVSHRDSILVQHRAWYKRNADKQRAWVRAADARRRGAPGSHTHTQEMSLLSQQRGLCYYCGEPMGAHPHLEHKHPIIRGGSDNIDNLCFACRTCNLRKGTMTAEEFVASGRIHGEVSA